VAFGINLIGEFLDPVTGAKGFGVLLVDPRDGDLLPVKTCRHVVSGLIALTFLSSPNRKFLAYALGILTLIPILDGLIAIRHAGWAFTPVIFIRWGTAAFMLIIVELLRRGK
jgi:hypothetical protein